MLYISRKFICSHLLFRVDEYISRGLEGLIYDPDENNVYTKRKRDSLSSQSSYPKISSSDSTLPEPRKLAFPNTGWNTSFEKAPFFTRAEVDRHIKKSGKRVESLNHSVPTGMQRAITYLVDEYLHNIETNSDQRYFFFKAKCHHSYKCEGVV